MTIKVQRKMGEAEYTFEFTGDFKEVMKQSAFLMEKDYCWLDGFKESQIRYDVREADTANGKFIYVKRKARSTDGRIATSTLGTYQGGGYFWKTWEIYIPQEKNANGTDKPNADGSYNNEPNPDDIPF